MVQKKAMIKFMLIFQICYSVASTCFPPMNEQLYNSHRECALNGYYKAHEFNAKLPVAQVEDNRIFIKFWCVPKKPSEENEKKVDT